MRIAIIGSGAEGLYPSVGRNLAVQTVGLGETLAADHEIHVITRAERSRHGWMRAALRGATEAINGVTYHALPAEAECAKAVAAAGSLRRAMMRDDWLSTTRRKAIERLKVIRPEGIVIWNASPFVEPLRRAFPSATICLYETRGWHLDLEPEKAGSLLEPASRILVPSASLAKALGRHVPEVAEAIETVPLGVDTDLFRILVPRGKLPRRRDLIGGDGTILVHVGPLSPERGLEGVLRLHARLTDEIKKPHLFLLGPAESDPPPPEGDDPFATERRDHPALIQTIAARIGPWIRVAARPVPPQEVAHILGAARVLLAPRLDQPPTAQPLVEAMASGVPVVASNTGAHQEIVTSPDVGRLTEPSRPEAVVEACRELASLPPENAYEQGLRARQAVLENYTFEGMAARLLGILQELRG